MGWEELSNGDLRRSAEQAGFELLLTNDQRICYQLSSAPGNTRQPHLACTCPSALGGPDPAAEVTDAAWWRAFIHHDIVATSSTNRS